LDVAYDGTDFSGWASQPDRRTVQEELEQALATALGRPVSTTCAGRTDAGVHARGQVVHCDVPAAVLAVSELQARLSGLLPPDVAVLGVAIAPDGFDARFGALWRRYSYRVADAPVDPTRRRDTLFHRRPLDLERMNVAAAALLGEHDFAAMCRRREGASTVRRLLEYSWSRDSDGVALARVRADAFCHSMVRALVGSLLPVGDGRRDVTFPAEVLAAGQRDPRVTVVGPVGLCLEEVRYPADSELAARVAQTRAYRGDPAAYPGRP
jgi:tRNA pseudouridine38-40 synthase